LAAALSVRRNLDDMEHRTQALDLNDDDQADRDCRHWAGHPAAPIEGSNTFLLQDPFEAEFRPSEDCAGQSAEASDD
jgi:hypothetical protein